MQDMNKALRQSFDEAGELISRSDTKMQELRTTLKQHNEAKYSIEQQLKASVHEIICTKKHIISEIEEKLSSASDDESKRFEEKPRF